MLLPLGVLSPLEITSTNSDTSEEREPRPQSEGTQERTLTVTNSGPAR